MPAGTETYTPAIAGIPLFKTCPDCGAGAEPMVIKDAVCTVCSKDHRNDGRFTEANEHNFYGWFCPECHLLWH